MKVGDTVKLKPAMWQGIKPESYGLSFIGEYVVKRSDPDQKYPTIQIEGSAGVWDAGAFQLVKEKDLSKFKVGDKVVINKGEWRSWQLTGPSNYNLDFENTYTVRKSEETLIWLEGSDQGFHYDYFDLAENSSIERPVLEERKKDKIRMELVDQGFPLALLELAKVMTWANSNKGYKDHDWKNIPDAENAFKGAAARHRVKFDAQRSFGNEMLDCTDEESGIIHLAHECFNNLALLELTLAGKIK